MFTNRSTDKQTDRPLQEEHAESPVTPGIAAPPTIKPGHLSKLSSFKTQSLKRDKNTGNTHCDSLQ